MIINTNDYIKLYSNCFDVSILQETIKELKLLKSIENKEEKVSEDYWETHRWYNTITKETTSRNNEELEMSYKIVKHQNTIMNNLHHYIGKYINEMKNPHFDSWSGYSRIAFHRYKQGTNMRPHIDHTSSIFDGTIKGVPILSVVGQLNDNFDGGEFVILDKTIKMKSGDLLIFPSNFIFIHKVNKILKGTRFSFISWVY